MKTPIHLSLAEIGRFLEKLAEKSESVYWLSNPDLTRIEYISPAFDKIWGRPREVLYTHPELWISYLHPEDRQAEYQPIQAMAERVAKEGASARYEEMYRIVRPDGEVRWILDRGFPIYNDQGECSGVTGVAVDITKEKQSEEQLRLAKERAELANRIKADFIANMSHDLKTPLHTVMSLIEVLEGQTHLPAQEEHFTMLKQATKMVLDLVEEVLSFSVLEEGQFELRAESFSLRELIENTVCAFRSQAEQKGIKLLVSYCESVPKWVVSDPHALRRMVYNLLGNAIKFTEQGHVLLAVESVHRTPTQVQLQITIEDTGIGIRAEDLDHVFERFYRADPSYRGRYKGTGLGLTIVQQLAKKLGGELKVNSTLGQGSTFYCTLPFILSPEPASATSEFISEQRILIIDDYEPRAQVLQKQITGSVDCCSAAKALSIIALAQETQAYQLIFIDDEVQNPSIDVLANEIKQRYPAIKLICCCLESKIKQKQLPQAFRHCCLLKPISPSDLRAVLNNQLCEKSMAINKRKLRILLIEDNLLAQKATKLLLEQLNTTVTVVGTGTQALAVFDARYDIAFVDQGLPDMGGLELIEKMRAASGTNSRCLICALTAHAADEDVQQVMNAGADYFLAKPASLMDLQAVLRKIID